MNIKGAEQEIIRTIEILFDALKTHNNVAIDCRNEANATTILKNIKLAIEIAHEINVEE